MKILKRTLYEGKYKAVFINISRAMIESTTNKNERQKQKLLTY